MIKQPIIRSHWKAREYHHYSSVQSEQAMHLIDHYDFIGNETILDLGCGDGKITAELAYCVSKGSVVGLDQSREMLHFARKQFSSTTNLQWVQGIVEALPFEGAFNLVTSFFCLHWVKEKGLAFKNMYDVMQPGGKAILLIPNAFGAFQKAVRETVKTAPWRHDFVNVTYSPILSLSQDDYIIHAKEAEFSIVHCEVNEFETVFPNEASLGSWRAAITPECACLASHIKQQQFIQAVVAYYNDHLPSGLEKNTVFHQCIEMQLSKNKK